MDENFLDKLKIAQNMIENDTVPQLQLRKNMTSEQRAKLFR
jgi:hypothetical protein